MEKRHRAKLATRFRRNLKQKTVICLDISDNDAFMAPELVRYLEIRVARHLPEDRPRREQEAQ